LSSFDNKTYGKHFGSINAQKLFLPLEVRELILYDMIK